MKQRVSNMRWYYMVDTSYATNSNDDAKTVLVPNVYIHFFFTDSLSHELNPFSSVGTIHVDPPEALPSARAAAEAFCTCRNIQYDLELNNAIEEAMKRIWGKDYEREKRRRKGNWAHGKTV